MNAQARNNRLVNLICKTLHQKRSCTVYKDGVCCFAVVQLWHHLCIHNNDAWIPISQIKWCYPMKLSWLLMHLPTFATVKMFYKSIDMSRERSTLGHYCRRVVIVHSGIGPVPARVVCLATAGNPTLRHDVARLASQRQFDSGMACPTAETVQCLKRNHSADSLRLPFQFQTRRIQSGPRRFLAWGRSFWCEVKIFFYA